MYAYAILMAMQTNFSQKLLLVAGGAVVCISLFLVTQQQTQTAEPNLTNVPDESGVTQQPEQEPGSDFDQPKAVSQAGETATKAVPAQPTDEPKQIMMLS